jgi:hypothetical protein
MLVGGIRPGRVPVWWLQVGGLPHMTATPFVALQSLYLCHHSLCLTLFDPV